MIPDSRPSAVLVVCVIGAFLGLALAVGLAKLIG